MKILSALRSNLHVPMGSPETAIQAVDKPQMRIFILGARAESSLPPHVWEQLGLEIALWSEALKNPDDAADEPDAEDEVIE